MTGNICELKDLHSNREVYYFVLKYFDARRPHKINMKLTLWAYVLQSRCITKIIYS